MGKKRIYCLKSGSMKESDRLEIANLLIKAGYSVRVGREYPPGKSSGTYTYFVEYWEET